MNTVEAIRQMLSAAGLSVRKAGAAMHRAPTYLSSFLTRGSTPRADVLARVADVCGYVLALAPRGAALPDGALVIDPLEDAPQTPTQTDAQTTGATTDTETD